MASNPLDPIAVLQALGIANPSSLEPVSGGTDTAIWRVGLDGRTYALRVFHPGQHSTWEREKVAMALAAGQVPITAVLDWANATAGDRRADYARTYTILHFADFGAPKLQQAFAQGWQDGYLESTGPLEDMDFFYAWAGAYMVHDLTHKIEALAPTFTPERLAEVGRWADDYQRRVGLVQ